MPDVLIIRMRPTSKIKYCTPRGKVFLEDQIGLSSYKEGISIQHEHIDAVLADFAKEDKDIEIEVTDRE